MIRAIFASALPILGLSLVAAFTGPDLVTGLHGAPMIVAAPEATYLEHARFDGEACASTLLFGKDAADDEQAAGIRIVGYALRPDGETIELGIRDIVGTGETPRETVAVLFDENGRLVGVGKPRALRPAADTHGDCLPTPEPTGRAPI